MFDEKINQNVADRIRQLRQNKGYSQENLAHSAQLSVAYIGQLERNIKKPTIDTIARICDALDVSLPTFFLFDEMSSDTKYCLALETISISMQKLPPDSAMRLAFIVQELANLQE